MLSDAKHLWLSLNVKPATAGKMREILRFAQDDNAMVSC
jgi:hypothetical protein